MPGVRLISPDGGSTAVVSTYGARVLSWNCAGRERLFVPAALANDEHAAPHGGIPVLHPQFGFFGPGRKHGLVRDRAWQVERHEAHQVVLRVALDAAEAGAAYELGLHVVLSDDALAIELEAANNGTSVAEFTCGLHTYLRVDDIARAQLQGLAQAGFLDALDAMTAKPAENGNLRSPINVDRVYVQAPPNLQLDSGDASLAITQSGFADTVVWNPSAGIAAGFSDLAGDEWRNFLCVEAAQIKPPVQLAAGASWRGSQRLTVLDA